MASRTRQVKIRLTEREYATLVADARARSMSVASYVRLMACDKLGVSSILLYQDLLKASDELDSSTSRGGSIRIYCLWNIEEYNKKRGLGQCPRPRTFGRGGRIRTYDLRVMS